jgi:hypothetical protein
MDISVRVEGQSNSEQENNARMVCSNCSYQLERLSGAQAKVLCPRCNTWLDIDPNCGGSCLACHKTLSSAPAKACTETAEGKQAKENPISRVLAMVARAGQYFQQKK